MTSNGWRVEHHAATPAHIHALGLPDVVTRTLRIFEPAGSALVIGSTQPESDVNFDVARELDVDVVKRRSGGGAVLVEPKDIVWLDVLIPRGDPMWTDDVGEAFYWLGHLFRSALAELDIEGVEVHQGPLVATAWSKKICFAGLGPGECVFEGRKILGISQRRTRGGALFQCSLNRHFDGAKIAQLLSVPSQVMVEDVEPLIGAVGDLDQKRFTDAVHQLLHQH